MDLLRPLLNFEVEYFRIRMYLYRLSTSNSDWLAIYVENIKEGLLSKGNYPFEEMSLECRLLFGSCALLFDYIANHCNTNQVKLTKRGSLVLDYVYGESVQHIKIPTSLIPNDEAFQKQELLWYQATEEFLRTNSQAGKLAPNEMVDSQGCSESIKTERQPNLELINNLMSYQICSQLYRLQNQQQKICQTDFTDIPGPRISSFSQICEVEEIKNKEFEDYSFKAGDQSSEKDANLSFSLVHLREEPKSKDILRPTSIICSNGNQEDLILEDDNKLIQSTEKRPPIQLKQKEVAIEQNSRKNLQFVASSDESQNSCSSQLMESSLHKQIETAQLRLSKMEEFYKEQMISNFKIKGDLVSIHSQLQEVFRIIIQSSFQQGPNRPAHVRSTDRPTALRPADIDPCRKSFEPRSKLARKQDKIKRKSLAQRENSQKDQEVFPNAKRQHLKYEQNRHQDIEDKFFIESSKKHLDIFPKYNGQRIQRSLASNALHVQSLEN